MEDGGDEGSRDTLSSRRDLGAALSKFIQLIGKGQKYNDIPVFFYNKSADYSRFIS